MNPERPLSILHVEDNQGDIALIRAYLADFPVSITWAGTLDDAVRQVYRQRFDAVLLDLGLPDAAGLETVKRFREACDEVPLIVLTGYAEDDGLAALKAGADDFLSKSELAGTALWRTLRHASERRRLQNEIFTIVWRNADAMVVLDDDGHILFANPASARLFGRIAQEMTGMMLGVPAREGVTEIDVRTASGETIDAELRATRTLWNGKPCWLASMRDVSDRKRARALEEMKRQAESERLLTEARMALLVEHLPVVMWTTDRALQVNWSAGSVATPSLVDDLRLATETEHRQAVARGEVRFETRVGSTTFEGFLRRQPSHQGVVGLAVDVSERVRLEEQVRHAQRMEAIGRLAGGVAHDFNNYLTVILSLGELVCESLAPDDSVQPDLREMLGAAGRAASLTGQLLAFSRRKVVAPQLVDVNAIIGDAQRMIHRLIGERITLTMSLDPDVPAVFIDAGAFEQVLLNLCINARDAMPDGGALSIRSHAHRELPGNLETSPVDPGGEPPHGWVEVVVEDAGSGMPPQVVERIFEPFFTTKGAGKGTGLGLATAYGIVRQARGQLHVHSVVGEGTAMHIVLPGRSEDVASVVTPPRRAVGGGERVLVVEPDKHVRDVITRMLDTLGYRVVVSADTTRALALLDEGGLAVDLVVADVGLPGMNGGDFARAARGMQPGLRLLLMSSYAPSSNGSGGADPWLAQAIELIAKPFNRQEFAERVRAVLDADTPG